MCPHVSDMCYAGNDPKADDGPNTSNSKAKEVECDNLSNPTVLIHDFHD